MSLPPRVVCLGFNPALDLTYRVDTIVHGEAQRIRHVITRPGGKATNVARVANTLGGRVTLVLPIGGSDGQTVRNLLQDSAIDIIEVPIQGLTRRSVAVVEDDGSATVFNEPGPTLTTDDVSAIFQALRQALDRADVLVVSGSLPPGAPEDTLAKVVTLAHAAHCPVIVDASGAPLASALAAAPTLIKPNADELTQLVGAPGIEGAQRAHQRSPETAVLASQGPAGMVLVTSDGSWHARPPEVLSGNPTGAGDAGVAAAAIAIGRSHQHTQSTSDSRDHDHDYDQDHDQTNTQGPDWPGVLRAAVGASAAAVLEPAAGDVDPDQVQTLTESVQLSALPSCP